MTSPAPLKQSLQPSVEQSRLETRSLSTAQALPHDLQREISDKEACSTSNKMNSAFVFEADDPSSSRQSFQATSRLGSPSAHSPAGGEILPSCQPVKTLFRCCICNRGYERKSYRDEHQRNHDSHRVTMDLCTVPSCGKRFSNKNSLKRHVQSVSPTFCEVYQEFHFNSLRSTLRRSSLCATDAAKLLVGKTH